MRIALTHNLQISDSEDEAEFDRPETIATLTAALERLGHEVEPIEVSGPASRTVTRLEALSPDLVFNTAEGRRGRFREAFYPALFDELGIPYSGSDAHVCAITLDKRLTKVLLAEAGVPTPGWLFVDAPGPVDSSGLGFPVIVKPNFEGSSKGITQDSIVESAAELDRVVASLLTRYPTGVLVEEFILGRDVTVPYLEHARTPHAGVLVPADYVFDARETTGRKWPIYDYHLKQEASDAVSVRVPADIPVDTKQRLQEISTRIVRLLSVRDLGRVDFRITADGKIYMLEVNALPSLEPGAAIYLCAAQAGLRGTDAVLDAVVRSAAARFGLSVKTRGKRRSLKVGLTFNLKRIKPEASGAEDQEAEYDAPTTIEAIRNAIASYGNEVVALEANADLPTAVAASGVDVVFNIAEGIQGRNREAQVPALLELLGIPYTGSDPTALSLALDKALAKRIVRQAGLPTPDFFVMTSGRERLPKGWSFPAIVKPVAEGSSKGVLGTSVVEDEARLREVAREIVGRYSQGALVEGFLPGREFTVGLLGERRPRVLPPMEIIFADASSRFPVYSFEHKLASGTSVRYEVPAKVEPPLLKDLERVARGVFSALGCRDVARVDLRLDAAGKVHFIECNPLPGLTPGWSDLCLIAEAAGMDYRSLVGEILAPAMKRWRQGRRPAPTERTASAAGTARR